MSSIGLFDVKGLSDKHPSFQIGSPVFDRITITHPDRPCPFTIEVENNSPDNIYIQHIQFNNKVLNEYSLPYKQIVNGGTLKLTMGNEPNTTMTR